MKNLSNQINISIKEALISLNNKINGVTLLEILKYKLLEELKLNLLNKLSQNEKDLNSTSIYEDDLRKIYININHFNSNSIILNEKIKYDSLIISFNKILNILFEEYETKKKINLKLNPMMGVVFSKDTTYSIGREKSLIFLQLNLEDKLLNIENENNNTI